MKVMPKYPAYASGNCDFVTKRTKLDEDERIVVLDVDVDRLPTGNACMSSRTVKMMIDKLGWKLHTEEDEEAVRQARLDLASALEQLEAYEQLIAALERVFGNNTEETHLEVVK